MKKVVFLVAPRPIEEAINMLLAFISEELGVEFELCSSLTEADFALIGLDFDLKRLREVGNAIDFDIPTLVFGNGKEHSISATKLGARFMETSKFSVPIFRDIIKEFVEPKEWVVVE